MPIADYQTEVYTDTVHVNDTVNFTVRPLTLTDAGVIIEIHQSSVESLYRKVESYRTTVSEWNEAVVTDIVMEMVKASPTLVATIIATAADEWDQTDKVLKMPLTVQFDALRKIGTLTFRDLAGAKNFLSDLWSLIRSMFPAMDQIASAGEEVREAS